MNKTKPFLTLGLVTASCSLLAAEPDLSKLPPPSTQQGVTYAKDIRPLFEASCFGCHGEERHRGGLRLDSLEAVMKGNDDGAVVKPGKSKESQLLIAVSQIDEESAMPPKRGPGRGGGFGPGMMLAPQMISQGDKDGDKKLSQSEFTALADAWFDKLDPDKAGKVDQEQFVTKLNDILPPPPGRRGGGGPGGDRPPGGPPPGGP